MQKEKTDAVGHLDVRVTGIVQGVGFRPFVHRLAARYGVRGTVRNDSLGVLVEAEADPATLGRFVEAIPECAPPLALVESVSTAAGEVRGYTGFEIVTSEDVPGEITLVSPDVATCPDCLQELFDPDDRRYRYPFINCTHCGPRYTIIAELPYDRPKTSMASFAQCPACAAEYHDPDDRRFHAQPNACPVCGPQCALYDNTGRFLPAGDPVEDAREHLAQGRIVAVKGLGGFHLAVNAADPDAVLRLRARKRRDEKPFAVMARDLDAVRRIARPTPEEETLLVSPQRPIVLLEKPGDGEEGQTRLAPAVAPGNRFLGVMLPYTPLHHLLLEGERFPALVMTSGNFSEEPILTGNLAAQRFLAPVADVFLTHDRDILVRNDDSVCRSYRGRVYFLRRSRGYAPVPIRTDSALPPLLAVGGELKNTVAVGRGPWVFLSQHIGDLENSEVFTSFEETASHLQDLFAVRPALVAHDLHPEYLSTKFALGLDDSVQKVGVQHHHAHIVSCLADNGVAGPVIGLSLDGTGYGTDGRIWGGEVLEAGLASFRRAFHFRYTAMPGGARAIREPWRMALSFLLDAAGGDLRDLPPTLSKAADEQGLELVARMVARRLNCPETSSLGRLFDAVAALAGIRARSTFEGQAAMELEMVAGPPNPADAYRFEREGGVIDPRPVVRRVLEDVRAGIGPERVSARFHDGLVDLFADLCEQLRAERGLGAVALSGGVFQNLRLLTGLHERLERLGFTVYTHRRVPCNDGGLALGQAVAAAEIARRKGD
ncbi:MAG: carbamoyltransferase HypF [Acidobacteria bacterium]|nr:carbamoyltransferase HypF [Acidobacteriota bacterium]